MNNYTVHVIISPNIYDALVCSARKNKLSVSALVRMLLYAVLFGSSSLEELKSRMILVYEEPNGPLSIISKPVRVSKDIVDALDKITFMSRSGVIKFILQHFLDPNMPVTSLREVLLGIPTIREENETCIVRILTKSPERRKRFYEKLPSGMKVKESLFGKGDDLIEYPKEKRNELRRIADECKIELYLGGA